VKWTWQFGKIVMLSWQFGNADLVMLPWELGNVLIWQTGVRKYTKVSMGLFISKNISPPKSLHARKHPTHKLYSTSYLGFLFSFFQFCDLPKVAITYKMI
jgi:hypothetical protein